MLRSCFYFLMRKSQSGRLWFKFEDVRNWTKIHKCDHTFLLIWNPLTLSLATSEWKKRPPFEVCLKLCIKTVPAGAFSASIDLPSRHWERTAVDMQIISLVPSLSPLPVPPLPSLPPIFTRSLLCKRMLMPNVLCAESYIRQSLPQISNVFYSQSQECQDMEVVGLLIQRQEDGVAGWPKNIIILC